MIRLGITKEYKIPNDFRTPFTPEQSRRINNSQDFNIVCEKSELRCYNNKEYLENNPYVSYYSSSRKQTKKRKQIESQRPMQCRFHIAFVFLEMVMDNYINGLGSVATFGQLQMNTLRFHITFVFLEIVR